MPALINAAISTDGMRADRDEALNRKIKDKCDLEGAIQQAMAKADRRKYNAWSNDVDSSKYTPTSDGQHVWAAFWGGNKGIGADVVACLRPGRQSRLEPFLRPDRHQRARHAQFPRPLRRLPDLQERRGATGLREGQRQLAWRKEIEGGIGASPLPLRVGKEILAYVPQAGLIRPSDGALLCKAAVTTDISTPAINDGVIYGVGEKQFFSLKLPRDESGPLAFKTLLKTPWKNVEYHMPGVFTDSIIASPLYDRGLVYVVSQGGAMNVLDAKSGKRVYAHAMDSLHPRLTWVFVVGICSSTCLGGQYIFVRDDQGRRWSSSRARTTKNWQRTCWSSTISEGTQPESQSNFFFEGRRIYFRSRGFMYCIGE